MRNQDKQARKFGGFPFFVKIYNHFLKFFLHTPVDANDFSHAYHYEIVNEVKKAP